MFLIALIRLVVADLNPRTTAPNDPASTRRARARPRPRRGAAHASPECGSENGRSSVGRSSRAHGVCCAPTTPACRWRSVGAVSFRWLVWPVVGREPDDRVYVIRHHDEFIDRGRPAITTYGQQGQLYGPPGPRIIEHDRAFMRADRNEVRSRAAVIERRETDGTPVMNTGIESHSSARLTEGAADRQEGDDTGGRRQPEFVWRGAGVDAKRTGCGGVYLFVEGYGGRSR